MFTFDPRLHQPQYGGLKARLRPQSHAKHGLRFGYGRFKK